MLRPTLGVAVTGRALRAGWALAILLVLPVCQAEPVWIGRFEGAEGALPAPWEVRRANERVPPTRYQLRLWDEVQAVEALADRSMAMLARPVSINLVQTPVLCWRWRVDAPIAAADMRRKSGDDYAARMYIALRLPARDLSTLTRFKLKLARRMFDPAIPDAALNYVWDNRQPVGTEQASSYTDRVQMLVLRSGAVDSGSWRSERRNVMDDFLRLFRPGAPEAGPEAAPQVDFVAFGSDGDNTGSQAHAGFADLHFVAAEEPCVQG
jgi:hypothetical protein